MQGFCFSDPIITTASPKHTEKFVKSLGTTRALVRMLSLDQIRTALPALTGGKPIRYVHDSFAGGKRDMQRPRFTVIAVMIAPGAAFVTVNPRDHKFPADLVEELLGGGPARARHRNGGRDAPSPPPLSPSSTPPPTAPTGTSAARSSSSLASLRLALSLRSTTRALFLRSWAETRTTSRCEASAPGTHSALLSRAVPAKRTPVAASGRSRCPGWTTRSTTTRDTCTLPAASESSADSSSPGSHSSSSRPTLSASGSTYVSNGLPIARDWAQFFADMPHLRALGIGSSALIRLVLEAFEAEAEAEADSAPGLNLCPELEDLELCVGVGLGAEDDGPGALAEFILRTLGAWVRGRAVPLRALTVHTPRRGTDDSDSDNSDSDDSASESDSTSHSDEECSDTAGSVRHTKSSDLARKLCRDVGLTLKAFVCRVYLVGTDCPACSVEYKPHPEDWDATQFGELEDGVTYY